jgi:hypothetical protein
MQLKEKLAAAVSKRAADVGGQYRKLVRDAAAGKVSSPEEVLSALDRWGVEPEQFQHDLEKAEQRDAWRAQAAKIPELRARADAVHSSKAQAVAEYEAAMKAATEKFRATMAPLELEEHTIEAKLESALHADSQLNAIDPALIERRDAAQAELAAAERELIRLTVHRDDAIEALPVVEKELAKLIADEPQPGAFTKDIEKLKRRVADAKATPGILNPQIEEARRRKIEAKAKLAAIVTEARSM